MTVNADKAVQAEQLINRVMSDLDELLGDTVANEITDTGWGLAVNDWLPMALTKVINALAEAGAALFQLRQ